MKNKFKNIIHKFIQLNIDLIPSYIFIFIFLFIARPVSVFGTSMYPTLNDGEHIIIEKISLQFKEPERYDIMVFKSDELNKNLIKRIIALPGETVYINDSKIYVNGKVLDESYGNEKILYSGIADKEITLGKNEYFVLGDNRNASMDSRDEKIGIVNFKQFIGRYVTKLPF